MEETSSHLEDDDLQCFPSEEIMYDFFDVACAARSFENITEGLLKEGYRTICVKWDSST
jgi:hypothetical protein